MKIKMIAQALLMGATLAGAVILTGCKKAEQTPAPAAPAAPAGVGERTGAALDKAADKTVEAVKSAADATVDATGKAVEKTGEVLDNAGEKMQD